MPRAKAAYGAFCTLLDEGKSSSVISARLGVSKATVNRYVRCRVLSLAEAGYSPEQISIRTRRSIDQVEKILLSSHYQGKLL